MRIKHLLAILLALPLFMVACEPEPAPEPEKEYAAELTLTSEAEMNFDAAGGEGVITYTAKMVLVEVTRDFIPTVEATCEAEWVTINGVAENITFTVAANKAEARETKINVTYVDKSFDVVVKQAAKGEEPEYALDVKLAAAERIPSAEVELADNYFALAFVDDAENTELGIVLKGAEGETTLKAGNYTSEAETLLIDACEVFVWEPAASYTFADGIVTVAVEGETYTFDMEFADADGKLYHFTYEGTVLNMEPAEKPEPEAFVPVKVEAYREAHWDLGNFELQLFINDSLYHSLDMQDNVNPNDKYLSAGSYAYSTTITDWSNFVVNVETGEGAYLGAAEIELTHNEDGTSTIKGYIESEYGQRLNIDWTGVIAGFTFSTGGDTPQPGETVEFTATYFGGTYYGDGNYYIVVSDAEVTGDFGVNGATYYYFDIYAGVETEDLSVPNGTYTFDASNSYANGTFTEEYGYGFLYTDGVPTWYLYAEGSKLTVSDNKIVAELILTDGAKHIVTYEGSLSLAGASITEDIEINATGWDVIVEYYGQYYNDDTDNYYIQLFEDAESGNGRYFVLDLLADYATCVDHSGTFTCSDSYGINTFLSGYVDDGYLAGSWYAELEDGAATGVKAPLTEGTVTVTLNGDGTQTYTFDCTDDQGYKITGSVTANPYSSGYALSKGAQPKSKSYAIQLPKSIVR
ncbi:MAG: hypothetical protein E7135_02420 [Rikenellaceae bacterium]|nr:hypothetical protein [Rikenellaceae bacterium]